MRQVVSTVPGPQLTYLNDVVQKGAGGGGHGKNGAVAHPNGRYCREGEHRARGREAMMAQPAGAGTQRDLDCGGAARDLRHHRELGPADCGRLLR